LIEKEEVWECLQLICDHFSIPDSELSLSEYRYHILEENLTSILDRLLNSDMNRLLNSLYRIDVDELVFKKILATEPPENLSRRIAQEIIKRESLKVKTRAKYKKFDSR
jgi:hypothetical protein